MRTILLLLAIVIVWIPLSCSKTGGIPLPPPPDPCLSVNIGLNGSVINPSVAGAADGSIKVWSSSGVSCTYNINNGSFQNGGNFNSLKAGNYTIMAKTGEGCTSSVSFSLADPVNVCLGININVAASSIPAIPCEAASGAVTVTATGGTGPYYYSINGGSFQSTNIFDNLSSGSYTITVKDANGCTGSGSTTIGNATAGPLFSQVRALIQGNCLYCHGGAGPGPVNYAVDCNIVTNKLAIKARVVDGNPSPMPPSGALSAVDKQKIVNWINAGGRFSD